MAGGLSPRVFHEGTRARLTGQPRLCERIEVVRNASDGDGNFNDCVVVCTMTASRPPEVMSFRIDHPGSRRKHRVSYKAKLDVINIRVCVEPCSTNVTRAES